MKKELSRDALKLLKKLAVSGSDDRISFDGRTCRPLLSAGLIRVKRSKDGKRILEATISAKGRKYLTPPELLLAAKLEDAPTATMPAVAPVCCPDGCDCQKEAATDVVESPCCATPCSIEGCGPTGMGC